MYGFKDINRMLTSVPPICENTFDIQKQLEEGYKRTVVRNNEKIANDNKFKIRKAECTQTSGHGFIPGYVYCFDEKLSGPLCKQCMHQEWCNKSLTNKKEK